MNFLGHLYLSGNEPLVIVGNFMADAVKGSDLSAHHPDVVRGIRMHRAIDVFTDTHPLTRTGRLRTRSHAGRYAGVVLDLFYDHLLAVHWERWHAEPLAEFNLRMYGLLEAHREHLPPRTLAMLPYMVRHDWLGSYARVEGIGRALEGLAQRVPAGASMRGAERLLREHGDAYLAEFEAFLPEVEHHVRTVV
jgi:acyl carrier protein phosphodiesterase